MQQPQEKETTKKTSSPGELGANTHKTWTRHNTCTEDVPRSSATESTSVSDDTTSSSSSSLLLSLSSSSSSSSSSSLLLSASNDVTVVSLSLPSSSALLSSSSDEDVSASSAAALARASSASFSSRTFNAARCRRVRFAKIEGDGGEAIGARVLCLLLFFLFFFCCCFGFCFCFFVVVAFSFWVLFFFFLFFLFFCDVEAAAGLDRERARERARDTEREGVVDEALPLSARVEEPLRRGFLRLAPPLSRPRLVGAGLALGERRARVDCRAPVTAAGDTLALPPLLDLRPRLGARRRVLLLLDTAAVAVAELLPVELRRRFFLAPGALPPAGDTGVSCPTFSSTRCLRLRSLNRMYMVEGRQALYTPQQRLRGFRQHTIAWSSPGVHSTRQCSPAASATRNHAPGQEQVEPRYYSTHNHSRGRWCVAQAEFTTTKGDGAVDVNNSRTKVVPTARAKKKKSAQREKRRALSRPTIVNMCAPIKK